ncbi:MAG: ARPP-1 family domain-containing protein [Planctomycetaceae bacterium]
MISDEMRELLSAYADGELRDTDAARVEEMVKRDAALRREIADLRGLGRTLRAWDEAEHAVPPSPQLKARAMARARSFVAGPPAVGAGRLFPPRRSLAAAALLASAALGLLLARGSPPSTVTVEAEQPRIATAPLAPLPDLAGAPAPDSALPREEESVALARAFWSRISLRDLFEGSSARGAYHDGVFWEDGPYALFVRMEEELGAIDRLRASLPEERETRTGVWNAEALQLVRGFEPARAAEALVLFRRAARDAVDPVRALGVKGHSIMDHEPDPMRVLVANETDEPVLLLMGEVLVAGDKTRRTRVVAADSWVGARDTQIVPVAWADAVEAPVPWRANLDVRQAALGPALRRMLAGRPGRDAAFLQSVAESAGGRTLADDLDRKDSVLERRLAQLLKSLEGSGDASLTGFAVLAGGEVKGVELFSDPALMRSMAPRLLRGYLRELGDSLDLRAPGAREAEMLRVAERMVLGTPARTLQVEERRRDGWPAALGLREVTLRGPGGKVIGHGLMARDRPVHLALFP